MRNDILTVNGPTLQLGVNNLHVQNATKYIPDIVVWEYCISNQTTVEALVIKEREKGVLDNYAATNVFNRAVRYKEEWGYMHHIKMFVFALIVALLSKPKNNAMANLLWDFFLLYVFAVIILYFLGKCCNKNLLFSV